MIDPESTTIDGEVEVEIVTSDGPELVSTGGGAIRITVAGERVHRYTNEERYDGHDWDPKYVGDFLAIDLSEILDSLLRIKTDAVNLYEPVRVEQTGHGTWFLFERIGMDVVRVAFQMRVSEVSDVEPSTVLPTPESARGYAVDMDDLCREVVDAALEFYERSATHDVPQDHIKEKAEKLTTLVSGDEL